MTSITPKQLFTAGPVRLTAPQALRFVPGTRLATPEGPRLVETLEQGQAVETLAGPRPVTDIALSRVPRADWAFVRPIWPVRVPVGSLGNTAPLRLAPDQWVHLSGQTVHRISGAPSVVVQVSDLVGLRGIIVERPLGELRYHEITLGEAGVVFADGAACQTAEDGQGPIARDLARQILQAMHERGEPPLRVS